MKIFMINLLSYILILPKSVFMNMSYPNPHANASRRLLNGVLLTTYEKPFVVYIARAVEGDKSWICGGAIVKPKYVLTAAACVNYNIPLYVVAGIKSYVAPSDWVDHQCIKNTKRKIVRICRPKEYKYDAENFFTWLHSDISVAEVDIAYDFADISYRMHCDYIPKPIRINYETRHQAPGRYGFIYGWGHRFGYTRPKDVIDYNTHLMRYANTKIISKDECAKFLPKGSLDQISMNSTLCTASGHEFDQDFSPMYTDDVNVPRTNTECKGGGKRRSDDHDCYNDTNSEEDFADEDYNMTDLGGRRLISSGGLCHNDHGAPLTTFIGAEEVLIGIGIAPMYDAQYRCREPSFFTSTVCMSLFLRCVFNEPPVLMSRRLCHEYTKKEGYYIEEIDKNHLDVNKNTSDSVLDKI